MRRERDEESKFEARANDLQEHIEGRGDEHAGDHWCGDGRYWHDAAVIPACPELELAQLHLKLMETHFNYYGNMPDDCLPVPVVTMLAEFYRV